MLAKVLQLENLYNLFLNNFCINIVSMAGVVEDLSLNKNRFRAIKTLKLKKTLTFKTWKLFRVKFHAD